MNNFKKLLNIVRENNPNLISEQEATDMLNDYDAFNEKQIADATAQGQSLGFKEGYDAAIEATKADTKQKLDELLEKCDQDATEKLNTIVDLLNNDHAQKLQEIYDLMKDTMVPVSELEDMDADHAQKFEDAMNAKDEYCANKLQVACEAIRTNAQKIMNKTDADHAKKLQQIHNIYESRIAKLNNLLTEEKSKKLDVLSESVEKYINYALQKAIPSRKLISEAKYNASQKAIEKIASILKINSVIQESKDGIFNDYEEKLSNANAATNKLMVENAELKSKLAKKEAKLMLESKIQNYAPNEAAFLRTYFQNASSKKIIEEQIEDARLSFKRLHNARRNTLVSSVKSNSTPASIVNESKKSVPTKKEPEKKVITEEKTKSQNSVYSVYADMLSNNKF